MKYIFLIIALFGIFSGLNSCYYDKEDLLYPKIQACDTLNVTYNEKVSGVFKSYCLGCHSASTAASIGGGTVLDNYVDVKNRIDLIYNTITHSPGNVPMPKDANKLDDCTINIIKIWKDQGAPNN